MAYTDRSETLLLIKNVHFVYYGSEIIRFLSPKILDLLPKTIKDSGKITTL